MTPFSRLAEYAALSNKGTKLLAVSKGHPASSIRELAMDGQIHFGESRLQEALIKLTSLNDLKQIKWHFIGHLQANKVRGVVKNFDFIHSIDSLKLAQRISRIACEENKLPMVMIQVKLRKDNSKSGFSEENLMNSWSELISLPNLKVVGLMTIAPIDLDLQARKILFRDCRLLADKLCLEDCSMGMSKDWKEAVEEGATWIRIGSLLFGERHK
ncbi:MULTISPECIES: YggS family pyridoxal phosphate-dependent enzyme [Prochlorococcus]|uniref:YggS family pyridoxal phosphate-dependent enzyme n=1 Tax=Prochlorococcus TaxID=1218 RepID=UPI0005338610|nr:MULTISPECIES: YggS family pyridoxal phosphate-dependent enzyme [Prochlorococcus]KGG13005.1 hypothetical protein EV05_0679 [Prochlorococcus sp. MIT 0601]